jgi:DNA-binding NtrC family response regulator
VTAQSLSVPLRVLIVEDEYLIAADLAQEFTEAGMEVIGPTGSIKQALRLISEQGANIDVATLDVNLSGELVFPVADALQAIDVPFVLCTGYDLEKIPAAYRHVPRFEKPLDSARLLETLLHGRPRGSG